MAKSSSWILECRQKEGRRLARDECFEAARRPRRFKRGLGSITARRPQDKIKGDRKRKLSDNSPRRMGRVWSAMSSSAPVVEDGHERSVTILYATETGTAQEVADRIAAQCRRTHVRTRVYNLEAYPPVSSVVCTGKSSQLINAGLPHLGRCRYILYRNDGVGEGTASHDAPMEPAPALGSAPGSLRRPLVCHIWPRRFGVREVLLACEAALQEVG